MILFSCKTQAPLEESGENVIHFGTGGGFAGIEKEYRLHDDGSLYFKISRDTMYHHIAQVTPEVTSQVFQNYQELKIEKMNLTNPGNMYSFIYSKSLGSKKRKVWDHSDPPSEILDVYHNTLLSIVQKFKIDPDE